MKTTPLAASFTASDWRLIRAAYIGGAPTDEIAAHFGISTRSLRRYAANEGWRDEAARAARDSLPVVTTERSMALLKGEARKSYPAEVLAAELTVDKIRDAAAEALIERRPVDLQRYIRAMVLAERASTRIPREKTAREVAVETAWEQARASFVSSPKS